MSERVSGEKSTGRIDTRANTKSHEVGGDHIIHRSSRLQAVVMLRGIHHLWVSYCSKGLDPSAERGSVVIVVTEKAVQSKETTRRHKKGANDESGP